MGLVGLFRSPLIWIMRGFFARRDIRLRISSDTDRIWTCLAAGACFSEPWEASLDLGSEVVVGGMATGLDWLFDYL